MNTWTIGLRPSPGRVWFKVAEAGSAAEARSLMYGELMDRHGGSGAWLACSPGKPPPRPQAACSPKPASRQGVIQWD